jgi:DNA-3-methyladenine glycosylase II
MIVGSRTLTRKGLVDATKTLATLDDDLARILSKFGGPPLWARRPGFVTLIRIILEQQVSLASARAIYRRLAGCVDPLTPDRLIETGSTRLRSLGLTRQKTAYCLNVAQAIETRELDLRQVGRSDDDTAMSLLIEIKGVGPWTAECYLLMALRRPDVWPAGDIALATAVQEVKRLRQRPSPRQLTRIAENWRPHRAAAARMLWHHYLSR